MQHIEGRRVFSATDLNEYLACEYLTALELAALRGELRRPTERPRQAELLARLGDEHEQGYLRTLQAAGRTVTIIERGAGLDAIRRAAHATEEAMARGDDVIYQATFFDADWLGYADFLRKIPSDGGRWRWHYEVEDTKLAHHAQPYFLLQLAYYSDHVARLTGVAPIHMHIVLGTGARLTYRVADVAAYYRSIRERFLVRVDADEPTYPLPVEHCGLCGWRQHCERRWREDDHLSLVADISRLQIRRLDEVGITTLRGLAQARPEQHPPKMVASTFAKLQRQARLQHEQRLAVAAGEAYPYRYEILASGLDGCRGFRLLPTPSAGDLFFDMEGDPYYELGTGLEYLFGAYTTEGEYRAFWGCDRGSSPGRDRSAEKRAFEEFVDFALERRTRYPDMHVYHYASYEKSALQRLSLRHATREDELDLLLREERLVDLYTVVRQAVAVGQDGYSIKKLEELYGKRGDDSQVKAGDDSILRFEEWLALRAGVERDAAILADLERYNRADCVSTLGLRDWLLGLRGEAERTFGIDIPLYAGREPEVPKRDPKFPELKAELEARIPPEFDAAGPAFAAARAYYLARHMLEYHWREDKPVYWQFHDRCERYRDDPTTLLDDAESLIGIEPLGRGRTVKKSQAHPFRFPAQLHKIDGGDCYDLETKKKTGEIIALEDGDEFGTFELLRGPSLAEVPFPRAIAVRGIVPAGPILDALARFARALLDDGPNCRYRAARDVLTVSVPRLRGVVPGAPLQPATPDETALRALCARLDESYLFIQGPPGAGKTFLGARLIVGLLADGLRVGVTANSHKAIHNLLDEVERVADERDVPFAGVKKSTRDDPESFYGGRHFRNDERSLVDPAAKLVAGTAWAFAVPAMDRSLDVLFIDEAGQVALPHAIAVLTAARNVVLLGDPLQLPQVAHTRHPGDVGVSVLEHLLDRELRPVAPERGVLLTDSYRMHPDVCGFISELLYEGKLRSAPGRELQAVDSEGLHGTGLRYVPVEHEGNAQRSDQEAERIASEIGSLLGGGGRVCDVHGVWRPLGTSDVIVVTPYNAQVRAVRRALDARGFDAVEVGTVDRFQGREAYVVFFSTAASSPDEASRGMRFVFDRQRFNVAVSRARALAVLVGSPRLLVQRCTSVDDVRIANGICRFRERALHVSPPPAVAAGR